MNKQPASRMCFICGRQNPVGLKLDIYSDVEHREVRVNVIVDDKYQSYPGIVHGGIVAAMLDEVSGRAVLLDGAPAGYRPVVQVIDNVSRNYKLGMIFEFRVGKGKLLVCMADLPRLKNRPEAAQLLQSLLAYAGSAQFQPATAINLATLKRIISVLVVHA